MITAFDTPSARAAWMYSKLRPRRNSARTSPTSDTQEKQQQDAEQHEEAGHEHRRQDQQQIERRDRSPYLDETLEQQVDPAAEIALHRAGRDADDGGDDGQAEAEQHRDAEAVDQPRHHVAALIVGAEPVVFQVAAALETLLLDHRLALRFRQHPGRRRRCRRRQIEIVGVVGVADQRPDDAAAFVPDQLLQIGIAIIGRRFEVAAESGFRIGDDGRPVEAAIIFDHERPVIGDQLGEQRHHKQDHEEPERPVAAPVRLEILPAAPVERRRHERFARDRHRIAERRLRSGFDRRGGGGQRHQTSRASKSIRGSIHI
ncbi:hypothetical protein ACVWZZ_005375 [Bradyrhizobium sp. LM6.10]